MVTKINKKLTALFVAICLLAGVTSAHAQGNLILQVDPSSEDAITAAIAKVAEEAYQLNMRGLDALEAKDNAAALELFGQALAVFPQYSDAMNNRGVALYRRGDIGGARRAWEQTVRSDPQYHVAYYNLGLLLLHEKKPNDAMRQFELALRHNGRFTEAMLRIGWIHLQAGNVRAAVEQYARAYRNDPKHSEVWNFYSYGLLAAGDTARAITILREAGDKPEAQAQLGRVEFLRKRYAEAATHLARAVELGAPPSVTLELATAQSEAGNCRGALATLDGYFARETRPSVEAWLLAGNAAHGCAGYGAQKALEYYDRGLRQYPRDPMLSYNAGYLYFTRENYAQAERLWGGVGNEFSDPNIHYMRAVAARARNDLNAAETHVKKAISMDENADYYNFLGLVAVEKGDRRAAEGHFRRALRINPGLEGARMNLAMIGRDQGDLERAAADASRKLASCGGGNCLETALQLAVIYYHQKKYAEALRAIETVPERERDLRAYRYIAIFNRELNRHDRAVAALETAVSRFPNDAKARYELAEAYLSSGAPAKAARIFEELRPSWKDNVWRLHYQLGYAYMEMGDLARAKTEFERSIAARRNNPAARGLLAFVLNRMGDNARAVTEWEKTVEEDGSNATIHINLGLSYERRGEYNRALESYAKARSLAPNDKAIHINIGNVYQGMGRATEAFNEYTLGLESNKRDEAAYNIFLLARKRGDNERAARMHELLTKEFPRSQYTPRVSADMLLHRGDTARALAAYEAISEQDTAHWYALATIYASRGDRVKTREALARIPDGDAKWVLPKKRVSAQLAFTTRDFREAYRLYRDIAGAAVGGRAGREGESAEAYMYNAALSAHNAGMHGEAIAAAAEYQSRVTGSTRTELMRIAAGSAVASKNWAEAKRWYSQLVIAEPNSAVTLYNLAVAHYNLGEAEEAYNRYQQARRIDGKIQNRDIETRYEQARRGGARQPTQPQQTVTMQTDTLETMYNQALALQRAGKTAEAEAIYKRIVERDDKFGLAWNNLGVIYGARGDLEEAAAAYTKALETQTTPETYANLANVYIALEDMAKAREVIKAGLEKNPGNRTLMQLQRQAGR